MTKTAGWTTVDELISKLRARWVRGVYLRSYARGEPFDPVELPVRSPNASDLISRLDEALRRVERFDTTNRTGTGRQLFVVEHQVRRSRALGDNPVPVRVRIDTLDQLCATLGTASDLKQLDHILALTRDLEPGLLEWVADHPTQAVAYRPAWEQLLTTVRWVVDHDHSDLDVRHLDAPGINIVPLSESWTSRDQFRTLRCLIKRLQAPRRTRSTDRGASLSDIHDQPCCVPARSAVSGQSG